MPKRILFEGQGWLDYMFWQENDKKILKRINLLIGEIMRNPYQGLGKPETLRHDLQGFWSRRIDQNHRIVYRIVNDHIEIIQCRTHYES